MYDVSEYIFSKFDRLPYSVNRGRRSMQIATFCFSRTSLRTLAKSDSFLLVNIHPSKRLKGKSGYDAGESQENYNHNSNLFSLHFLALSLYFRAIWVTYIFHAFNF